jgi:hypothetical protein
VNLQLSSINPVNGIAVVAQPNRGATRYLGEIWVSDCMLQRLHARLLPLRIRILHILTHTEFGKLLRPTTGKSSSAAGLSTLVHAYVVDCAPAPMHTPRPHTGFPMRTHLSRLRLFQEHLWSLVWVWVWVWDGCLVWASTSFSPPHPSHTLTH